MNIEFLEKLFGVSKEPPEDHKVKTDVAITGFEFFWDPCLTLHYSWPAECDASDEVVMEHIANLAMCGWMHWHQLDDESFMLWVSGPTEPARV